MSDLKGYIRQATAARRYGRTAPAISQLISRGRLKTKEHDGVVYVLEDDLKNFTPQKTGPKSSKKAPRKKAGVV